MKRCLVVLASLGSLALACSDAGGTTPDSSNNVSDAATPAADGAVVQPGADAGGSKPGADAEAGAPQPTKPIFVVGGYQFRRLVSTDAKTWTNDTNNPPDKLDDVATGIAVGNGLILMTAHSGAQVSSDSGKTWKKLPAPLPQAWPGLGGSRAIWDGTKFVVVAGDTTYTSTDTVTWQVKTDAFGATHWNSIAMGGGHLVVVGDSNNSGGDRKVSEDGVNWHDYMQGGAHYQSVAYGAGVFVAVGASHLRQWSTDGVKWTDVTDATADAASVVFANGQFYAYGSSCWLSADGKSWATKACNNPPSGVRYFNGVFLGSTWESNLYTATDGLNFTKVFSGNPGTPALAAVGGGLLL